MVRSGLLSPALCKVWVESDGSSSVVDQILVTSGSGAVSLLTQREGDGWEAEAVRREGAWPCWRPGYPEIAVSVTREPQGSAVEVVELQPGGFRTNASFAVSGEPNAIAPRVPHYVMWSPDGSMLSVVSRAGETLGLTCFPAHGGAFGTEVTGAPIFSTWTCDSTRLVVHAGPRVLVVEPSSGEILRTISDGAVGFRAPAISGSGRVVYAEPRDGALRVMQTSIEDFASSELAQFDSGAVLAFRPKSEDLTVGLAAAAESGALAELWLIAADGARRRIARGPFVGYSWSPAGDKLALVVPAQTGDGRNYVRVIDPDGGELCASEALVPSQNFRLWLAFFDQYSQSHSLWDEAGETLLLAGRRVDDSVHSSLGDPVGDKVYAWRVGRNQPLEFVAPGQTGFFGRSKPGDL